MKNELVKTNEAVKKVKREFHKINNTLAQISQDEVNISQRKKELTAKKKELTKSIDEELKDLKNQQKRLTDKRIFTLGERNARMADLKQLGLSNEVTAQIKKGKASIHQLQNVATN